MAGATGFEVVGLSESIKLLGRADKELRKEAGKVVRSAAIKLQAEGRRRIMSAPGVRRDGYPRRGSGAVPKGAVTRRSTATSGKIGINTGKYPVAGPAEFGWNSQFVPYRYGGGRFMPQGAMRRRTFPIWRGNQFTFPKYGQKLKSGPGWAVQPVLRKRLGQIQEEVNDGMAKVFKDSARRAGVLR